MTMGTFRVCHTRGGTQEHVDPGQVIVAFLKKNYKQFFLRCKYEAKINITLRIVFYDFVVWQFPMCS